MKVLIVDDELPIREWMKFSLEKLGKGLELWMPETAMMPGKFTRGKSRDLS